MQNYIFYFSGTGNSLYVAKKVANALGNTSYKMIHIDSFDKNMEIEADILGFVFPVYAFGLPKLAVKFLEQLKIKKANYVFGAFTYGGNAGNIHGQFSNILIQKNISVDLIDGFTMPSNWTVGTNPPGKEKVNEILSNFDDKIDNLTTKIKDREKSIFINTNFFTKILYYVAYPFFAKFTGKSGKNFWADEKCNQCGLCEKICPTKNISIPVQNTPQWSDNCEQCMACINWCPQKAIQYKNRTQKRNRYTNPNISIKEMFRENG